MPLPSRSILGVAVDFPVRLLASQVIAILLAAGVISAASAQTVDEDLNWRQTLYRENLPSVVSVLPQTGGQRSNVVEPEGTGITVERFILTADHVLGPANRVLVRDYLGNVSEASIFLRDPASDLALLKPTENFKSLKVVETATSFGAGSQVCTLGNAYGLGLSLTCGIVSINGQRGIGFNFVEDFIQVDAAVNPGMSGAPLFDRNGHLVGLVTAIFTKQSDGNLGVNFAASGRLVQAFIEDAKDGRLDRAKAGMVMQKAPLPGETGRAGGLVKAVASNSTEERAGVKAGDLVLRANDLIVKGQADYIAALVLAGEKGGMELDILRDGEEQTLHYQLRQAD